MKIKLIVCIVAALALVGCSPPTPRSMKTMQEENQKNVNNPVFLANTSQGKLYLMYVWRDPYRSDRVYFFDTNATVSVNSESTHGKQSVTETTVIVNGKVYVPKQ